MAAPALTIAVSFQEMRLRACVFARVARRIGGNSSITMVCVRKIRLLACRRIQEAARPVLAQFHPPSADNTNIADCPAHTPYLVAARSPASPWNGHASH